MAIRLCCFHICFRNLKKEASKVPLIVIPHFYERSWFSKTDGEHIVLPTEPWNEVIEKILDSEFVISGSLHGLIIAEAYGIPARYMRLSDREPLFKYLDYYLSTGRSEFSYALSVEEALKLGGEPPIQYNPEPLYDAFPFEFWPSVDFVKPTFNP